MADSKISALTELTAPVAGDWIPIVDTSASSTKKVDWSAIRSGVFNAFDYGATGDGTTDDRAACQAAIDAAEVSGGTVLFPAGTYRLTAATYLAVLSCLTIKASNVYIILSKGAILKCADSQVTTSGESFRMVRVADSISNVTISGAGKIDGNRSGQTDTSIGPAINSRNVIFVGEGCEDIDIYNIECIASLGTCIIFSGASGTEINNASVEGCIVNDAAEGILFANATNVKCINNVVSDIQGTGAQDGIEVSSVIGFLISGNQLDNIASDGIDLYDGSNDGICSNNYINNVVVLGTGDAISIGGPAATENLLVIGNVITNVNGGATQHGIKLRSTAAVSKVELTANIISTTAGRGVYISSTSSGALVTDNIISETEYEGVLDLGTSSIISTNIIVNAGVTSSGGISIQGTKSIIKDNSVTDTNAPPVMDFGCKMESTGDQATVSGNVFTNMNAQGIWVNGADDAKIINNVIIDAGMVTASQAIRLVNCDRTLIDGNSIVDETGDNTANTLGVAIGVLLVTGGDANMITRNTCLAVGGSSPFATFCQLNGGPTGTIIRGNNVAPTTSSANGFAISDNAQDTFIQGNVIRALSGTPVSGQISHDNLINGSWTT